jgi:hypothetical protein
MHGTPDPENLKAATLKFMQKVEQKRRKQMKGESGNAEKA